MLGADAQRWGRVDVVLTLVPLEFLNYQLWGSRPKAKVGPILLETGKFHSSSGCL